MGEIIEIGLYNKQDMKDSYRYDNNPLARVKEYSRVIGLLAPFIVTKDNKIYFKSDKEYYDFLK